MTRIRVVIAILGLDQHESGALAVAGMLRDAGMEVVYLGRFASPQTIAETVIQESADVVGVSAHSWEYLEYVDELVRRLAEAGGIPLVIGGSVVTAGDRLRLLESGVAAAFGASSSKEEIVSTVRRLAG